MRTITGEHQGGIKGWPEKDSSEKHAPLVQNLVKSGEVREQRVPPSRSE